MAFLGKRGENASTCPLLLNVFCRGRHPQGSDPWGCGICTSVGPLLYVFATELSHVLKELGETSGDWGRLAKHMSIPKKVAAVLCFITYSVGWVIYPFLLLLSDLEGEVGSCQSVSAADWSSDYLLEP